MEDLCTSEHISCKNPIISNEKYEAAMEVILSLEADLLQKNINSKTVLETIKEAQERSENLTTESDDLRVASEIHDINLVRETFNSTGSMSHGTLINNNKDTAHNKENVRPDLNHVREVSSSNILSHDIVPGNLSFLIRVLSLNFNITLVLANIDPLASSSRDLGNALLVSCSSFDKHLKFPDSIKTKTGKIIAAENRPPMSIISAGWKQFHKNINRAKEQKKSDVMKRKVERLEKKNKVNTKVKSKRRKRQCPECENDLDTDSEDESLQNIGCDSCDEWYHLKCTIFRNVPFIQIEHEKFICNLCKK